ncbi:hypothetical protein EG358_14465 [Chryseobacterium indoltheticum]|nr:hypothetical protein EG358_14465 [Chryseobacterium indoltheticum]
MVKAKVVSILVLNSYFFRFWLKPFDFWFWLKGLKPISIDKHSILTASFSPDRSDILLFCDRSEAEVVTQKIKRIAGNSS